MVRANTIRPYTLVHFAAIPVLTKIISFTRPLGRFYSLIFILKLFLNYRYILLHFSVYLINQAKYNRYNSRTYAKCT
jgi:hypothetical protein